MLINYPLLPEKGDKCGQPASKKNAENAKSSENAEKCRKLRKPAYFFLQNTQNAKKKCEKL